MFCEQMGDKRALDTPLGRRRGGAEKSWAAAIPSIFECGLQPSSRFAIPAGRRHGTLG